jgi:cell division protein FtsZ
VLFNVTGGYDMSMSEIQEAAEIITSAVSPDANIIFGATLKPELDDELIITVIATGFDSAYFEEQAAELEMPGTNKTTPAPTASNSDNVDSAMVEAVNLELDKDDPAASFAEDNSTNIWDQPEEDEDDTPAFLRRRKKKKNNDE